MACVCGHEHVYSQAAVLTSAVSPATQKSTFPLTKKIKRKKLVDFNFENEDLVNIVNYLASEKKVNIILPVPPHNITSKVTIHHQHKLTVDESFKMLNTLLDVAGYVMTPRGDTFVISKIDQNTPRETLPIYIGVSPDMLPDSDERVRYLYYFDNIKIPQGGGGQAQEMKTILDDMLQEPNKANSSQVLFDAHTNCVIITGKAYSIKVAMQIITELDKTGFREVIEVVKLINTSAGFVAKFLMEQLVAPAATAHGQPAATAITPPGFDSSYFTKTTKIIPDLRTNTLIILGRAQAVDRIKEFTYKYIDIPLESGDSILHPYELQYLDATTFAEDLRNIIKPREVPGGQSKAAPEERAFEGVIIEAEKVGVIDKLKTQIGDVGDMYQGGNRLIIAAKKNDWLRLKRLIEDLDKPQPQVSLECLVVDVSLDGVRQFGSQIRNKQDLFNQKASMQAANLAAPVLNNPVTTLMTNLLLLSGSPPSNIASNAAPGTFIISFNDPASSGIYWIASILRDYTNSKILSHPFLTVLNHQQAKVSLAQNRLVTGPAKQNPDGTLTIQQVNISAAIQVEMLPRINLSNTINLQIAVKVNNFVSVTDNTVNTRTVITNATIGNGEILVLGGLVQTTETEAINETPLLSKLPLVGWLFKNRTKEAEKDSLMIFIAPSVVKPKLAGGMSPSSASKFEFARNDTYEGQLFDQIHDPVTRWFFNSPSDSINGLVNDFGSNAHFKPINLSDLQPATKRKKTIRRDSRGRRIMDKQRDEIDQNQALQQLTNTTLQMPSVAQLQKMIDV